MHQSVVTKHGWLLATVLFLCLAQARVHAQTSDGTQIIGYLNSSDVNDMTDLASSKYTTFIDGFLAPTASTTISNPVLAYDAPAYYANTSELSPSFVDAINTVETAGKNVLLSFGGQDAASYYAAFGTGGTEGSTTYTAAQATQNLANILAAYVTGASSYQDVITNTSVPITTYAPGSSAFKGFSGIDLDFEDTQSFQPQNAPYSYNGVNFLTNLTNDLHAALPAGKIITQAPQTLYLDPLYTQGNNGQYGLPSGGYQAVISNGYAGSNPTLTAAGRNTTWFNVQFYNNTSDDGDNNPQDVVNAFIHLVQANPDLPTSKLVLTLPMYAGAAGDNVFTNAQIQQIILGINGYLKGQGDGTIAGVAGFQLYDPTYYNAGDQAGQDAYNEAFANSIAQVDTVPEPSACVFGAMGVSVVLWLARRRKVAAS